MRIDQGEPWVSNGGEPNGRAEGIRSVRANPLRVGSLADRADELRSQCGIRSQWVGWAKGTETPVLMKSRPISVIHPRYRKDLT